MILFTIHDLFTKMFCDCAGRKNPEIQNKKRIETRGRGIPPFGCFPVPPYQIYSVNHQRGSPFIDRYLRWQTSPLFFSAQTFVKLFPSPRLVH